MHLRKLRLTHGPQDGNIMKPIHSSILAAAAVGAALGTIAARMGTKRIPLTSNADARPSRDQDNDAPATATGRDEGSSERIGIPKAILKQHETGTDTARRVRHLLRLRSRIDRLAWNTLGYGPYGTRPMPGIKDWTDRCMFLVAIGVAFEDMLEVLDRALADPDGTSARSSLLHRASEAYGFLASTLVPARWNDSHMEHAWHDLCEAVAAIIGHEPNYGTTLSDTTDPR